MATLAALVDIAPFLSGDEAERRKVAKAFGEAFETTGFATIVGHGIDETLANRVYAQLSEFFSAPIEEKLACAAPEKTKGRGYLPIGIESVAATLAGETPPDICEALVFRSLARERAGEVENIWPTRPPELASLVSAWYDSIFSLTANLMRMAALALDLPEDYFAATYADPAMTLRFVNYPDQEIPPRPGQLRYGAHHDYGGLTILRQDNAPGVLQIADREGNWRDATPVAGSFVVNVGDLMARWTNGRWRSTLHRVINPPRELTGSTRRLSIVAFTGPNEDTLVSALPSCVGPGYPSPLPPVRAGDYVWAKLTASMDVTAEAASA
jgi:isopenicillin N synthase-like dioxygenase